MLSGPALEKICSLTPDCLENITAKRGIQQRAVKRHFLSNEPGKYPIAVTNLTEGSFLPIQSAIIISSEAHLSAEVGQNKPPIALSGSSAPPAHLPAHANEAYR